MVSEIAIDDIAELEAQGLHPTPQDIIRLNALALKAQASKAKNAVNALEYLPRVAKISEDIIFRQPTIGHEVWLAKVEQYASADFQTILAVRAFALSRAASELPDALDHNAVRDAVGEYSRLFANYTRTQILAALEYVINGANPLSEESAPSTKDDGEDERIDLCDGEDWSECVAVGILHEAQVMLTGMTAKEIGELTRQQVNEMLMRVYIMRGADVKKIASARVNDYYLALNGIRERLISERENNGR